MSRAPARHSSPLRFTIPPVCAVFACLLLAAAPRASQVPAASEFSLQRAADGAETAAAARGVQILQHGTYPELLVDGRPFFINSAAFFYPRIPRSLWEPSLDRYRELGINTIELSIPWNWHEPREGEFDFDGHSNPRRDLHNLLQMIAARGFKLIARPGPSVLHEWRNSGYPDWLVERPEFHVRMVDRLEGRISPAGAGDGEASIGAPQMWLHSPGHLNYAGKWLEAVAHELAPYSARTTLRLSAQEPDGAKSRGAERQVSGPLLFVQVEEGPASGRVSPAAPKFWSYVETLCGTLLRNGVDAPCFVDPAQPLAAAAGSLLEHPVAVMGQWYLSPANEENGEERRISPLDVAELELTAASLGTQPAFPPALTEFGSGSFAPQDDERPTPSPPQNIRISSHLLLGFGLRGLNWFPLQDSLTPAGFETPDANRFYRWDAPLSLNATSRPGAREVARLGDWLRSWGDQLAASHLRADFGLVDTLAALPQDKLTPADIIAATTTVEQIERLALYAGISSERVDPEYQPSEQLLRHALLLFLVYRPEDPAFALSEKAQRTLEAYVQGGGVLVCFPGQPQGSVFERMEKSPAAESSHLPSGTRVWRAGKGRFVVLSKDFYSWVSVREDFAAGLKRFEASYARPMLSALFREAGVRPCISREGFQSEASELVATQLVSNDGTLPLGQRSGGQGWLSVVNLSDETAVSETLHVLSPRASARAENSAPGDWLAVPVSLPPRESLLLPLESRLCLEPEGASQCEDRVVSSGAELVRAEREGKTMFLTFYAPAKSKVRLYLADRPEHVEVDEVPLDGQWLKAERELVVELLRGASPQFLHVLRLSLPYRPSLPERPKQDGRHPTPAHFRFSPAGAVRLPLGEGATLLTNPPLFVFPGGSEGSLWVVAENRGGQPGEVQVRATGQFNTSARAFVSGNEIRSLSLKLPASAIAAAEAPAADGLFHGTLHFSAGSVSEDLPVAYAIVPQKGAIGYRFDFAADGSEERVLENSALRAIFSPRDGGRLVAFVEKSSDQDLASTMGLLEDAFSFTPDSSTALPDRARGSAGTFNREYAAEWIPGADGPALRLSYHAPDVYPHGARIEKTARLAADGKLAVEYRVSLLPADARRLEEEAAGRIFAAPTSKEPVPQSFVILSSIPADAAAASTTRFCWTAPQAPTAAGVSREHCEEFLREGPAFSPPPGVRRIYIRRPRRPEIALEWEDAGAILTFEPKNYSVLLRLVFPPLLSGGAPAAYRIEFSVGEGE